MENKQYPPRGGPPLVYRCRGSGRRVGWRAPIIIGITAHLYWWPNAVRSKDADPDKKLIGTGRFSDETTIADLSVPIAIGNNVDKEEKERRRHSYRRLIVNGVFGDIRIEEDVGPPGWQNLKGIKSRYKTRAPACPTTGVKGHWPGYIAVGFPLGMAMPNQRIEDAHARTGLQPHLNMRLKPEELLCPILIRQLKQTAIGSIPEGLHVYSQPVSKENSTPSGVAPGASVWCYKHLMPACSADRPLASSDGTKNRARDGTVTRIRDGTKNRARDGTITRIRDGTTNRARDGTEIHTRDGTIVHIRDDTGLHIRHGTSLGSRNTAASQPVHPPEWERYAEKRGKCRMMNNEYRNVQFNADSPDSWDQGRYAVRLWNEATWADLSACTAPDNVEKKIKSSVQPNYLNADRSGDADRLANKVAAADLSVPIVIGNNVGRMKKEEFRFDRFNAVRSRDADRLANKVAAADLSVPKVIGNNVGEMNKKTKK